MLIVGNKFVIGFFDLHFLSEISQNEFILMYILKLLLTSCLIIPLDFCKKEFQFFLQVKLASFCDVAVGRH